MLDRYVVGCWLLVAGYNFASGLRLQDVKLELELLIFIFDCICYEAG